MGTELILDEIWRFKEKSLVKFENLAKIFFDKIEEIKAKQMNEMSKLKKEFWQLDLKQAKIAEEMKALVANSEKRHQHNTIKMPRR